MSQVDNEREVVRGYTGQVALRNFGAYRVQAGRDEHMVDPHERVATGPGPDVAACEGNLNVLKYGAQAPMNGRAGKSVEIAAQDDGGAALGILEPFRA